MASAAATGGEIAGAGRKYYWGDSPDEDEYYASQGIRGSSSTYTIPAAAAADGIELFTRCWEPLSPSTVRGVVCMIHGYGNDTNWTFQATPIALARAGYACLALDLPGHGRSPGLRAFLPDLPTLAARCSAVFLSSPAALRFPASLPRFLYGESLGGAIALLVHLHHQPSNPWRGAVLVSPMCRISDRLRPSRPVTAVLTLLARVLPTLPLVPTPDLVDKSVKVESKRAIAASNPFRYNGRPRLGTVVAMLRATEEFTARMKEITVPFIVLHGSADMVTDPDVSRALYEEASSDDKKIVIYEGMWHSLLFGENEEDIQRVRNDIVAWLKERSPFLQEEDDK